MTLLRKDITQGLRTLGLGDGDIVLVHSSLRSFGYVEGGAETVIDSLLETVGCSGTVMVPTLTGKPTDGRENPPVFDVRSTPCWTGKIPEIFRWRPEAKRSLHPTHSVSAIGGRRDELVKGHEAGQSPCDRFSPYYKNAVWGGYILLIGVDQESNTTIHCCEEVAGVPYHLQKEVTDMCITGYDGDRIPVRNHLHDWQKPPTDFNRFDGLFAEYGIMKTGTIGNSFIRLIDVKGMMKLAVETLKKDPNFLLA